MPTKPKKTSNLLLDSALRLLAIRPRTQHELTSLLSRKTTDLKEVDKTITKLAELHLQSDQDFVTWFISSRLKQAKGPNLIKYELKTRFRPDPQAVAAGFRDLSDSLVIESALKVLDKFWSKITKLPVSQQKYQAQKYLYQRGFSGNIAATAIDEKWSSS